MLEKREGLMSPENARRKEIGQERRERTRQKLLQAAARVIAERGERKATIDDFVQAADVARGTFYNYYATRDELVDDLWAQIGRDPFRDIQTACHGIQDPAERLVAFTRMVLGCAMRDATWGWLVYSLSDVGETINKDLLAFPYPDLAAGRAAGRFVFHDFASASDLVVGTVRTALHALLGESRSPDYIHAICVLILLALGVSPEEARALPSKPLPMLATE